MFWDNFKKVCDERGVKPTPVLKETGISTGSIGRWQNGSSPNADAVIAIADYLGCSTDLLLRGEEFSSTDKFNLSFEEIEFINMLRVIPEGSRNFVFTSVRAAYTEEIARQAEEKRLLG